MSRIICVICLGLLAGCATPSPDMMRAARHEVIVEGIRFVVFHEGMEAEVVLMGYLTRHERQPVAQLMAQAIERTTGCRAITGSMVTRIPGDTGVARFDLSC